MQNDYCKANQMHTRMHIYRVHMWIIQVLIPIWIRSLYTVRWLLTNGKLTHLSSHILTFICVLANLRKESSMTHSTARAIKLTSRFILHNQLYTFWPMASQSPAPPLPLLTNFVRFLCILVLAHEDAVFFFLCLCYFT